MQRKPLYETLNEQYNKSIESDHLLRKKEVLASLRDLYKPIDFKKIEEEQKQKEDLVKEKNEEKRKQLLEWQKKNEESYDFKKFNSRYSSKILEDENNKQEIERNKEEHKRTLHQKMKSYNQVIKQNYAPIVSRIKQNEVDQRRRSLEMPPREKYK